MATTEIITSASANKKRIYCDDHETFRGDELRYIDKETRKTLLLAFEAEVILDNEKVKFYCKICPLTPFSSGGRKRELE